VIVALYDLTSTMDDDATSMYENTCGIFLNEQLSIATPPIYDLTCEVSGQEVEGSSSSSSSSSIAIAIVVCRGRTS